MSSRSNGVVFPLIVAGIILAIFFGITGGANAQPPTGGSQYVDVNDSNVQLIYMKFNGRERITSMAYNGREWVDCGAAASDCPTKGYFVRSGSKKHGWLNTYLVYDEVVTETIRNYQSKDFSVSFSKTDKKRFFPLTSRVNFEGHTTRVAVVSAVVFIYDPRLRKTPSPDCTPECEGMAGPGMK